MIGLEKILPISMQIKLYGSEREKEIQNLIKDTKYALENLYNQEKWDSQIKIAYKKIKHLSESIKNYKEDKFKDYFSRKFESLNRKYKFEIGYD